MINKLYPLKFKPLFHEKVWGGNKIKSLLGLDYGSLSNCGEAWVLSGVKDSQTIVSNGFLEGNELNELVEVYLGDLVGDEVFERYGEGFPLLVKFIDSTEYLSIQVHPDDRLAQTRHQANGKTELWYILDADKGAELISGFNRKMSREEYLDCLHQKKLKDILHTEKVGKGDVFFTPAGRVHAIGPGILLAEIQQTSDLTYRIYDWDRVDDKGNARALHTDLAIDAIDFSAVKDAKIKYNINKDASSEVIQSPFFSVNIINTTKSLKKDYSEIDSFVIHICTEGNYKLAYEGGTVEVQQGETVLIPNIIDLVGVIPEVSASILEVFIP